MNTECRPNDAKCEKKVIEKLKAKKLPLKERNKSFAPVNLGLTEEEAIKEAQRCLRTQSCDTCELCGLLCPDLCITKEAGGKSVAIDLDYCKGCGICAAVCPKGAIKMEIED